LVGSRSAAFTDERPGCSAPAREDAHDRACFSKHWGRGAQHPGALQFECNIGDHRKTVDFFERYTDSKAALFHLTESFAPFSKQFFAVAKLTRWVIYGTRFI
jgi:hypothetical protein